jgi:hypothetical protein
MGMKFMCVQAWQAKSTKTIFNYLEGSKSQVSSSLPLALKIQLKHTYYNSIIISGRILNIKLK